MLDAGRRALLSAVSACQQCLPNVWQCHPTAGAHKRAPATQEPGLQVYWLRHLFAMAAGVACGVLGVTGVLALVAFTMACGMGVSVWCKYQE